MKIIFSRKGFDSAAGGVPSPILPDGRMMSLPIPRRSSITYADLSFDEHPVGRMVEDLTNGRIQSRDTCHLDPDLCEATYPRTHGWKPIFGQRAGRAKYLADQGVSPGDLFLFFGWFREIEMSNGTYRYIRGATDMHVLFGWLQVGEILNGSDPAPTWAAYHPHFQDEYDAPNIVFNSADTLELNGVETACPGAGFLPQYREELCLTAPHRSRSWWSLPAWFYPRCPRPPLSYHQDLSRWHPRGDRVYLQSAARGQEFVLEADQYPEAGPWVRSLLANCDPATRSA